MPHRRVKIKTAEVIGENDGGKTHFFWCPGCNELHTFSTDRIRRPVWTFNGNYDNPTFAPSLLYETKKPRCHLFLQEGKLSFCSDSEHPLAGKTVDLPFLPDWMTQPVMSDSKIEKGIEQ